MEFRDLLFDDNMTLYSIAQEDKEAYLTLEEKFECFNPILEEWNEIILLKNEQKVDTDFTYIEELDVILISQKTKDLLQPFLAKCDVEYLPCKTEDGHYYIFHLTNQIENCIIEDISEYKISGRNTITDVTNLIFNFDKIEDKPIFKIKELPYVYFVSYEFEDFCTHNKITGLDFSENNPFIAANFI